MNGVYLLKKPKNNNYFVDPSFKRLSTGNQSERPNYTCNNLNDFGFATPFSNSRPHTQHARLKRKSNF